ncbi:MAG: UDP-3-O-(3-hydroxymyristoyl)glucosamine N-acyltransferase [Bryobacteraceae bacterium]|nr:UDP-3-O-(3-hydroxymyristoyl)glucosamine N-acyltransferase [Bryobacteraceae bacterium]
MRLTELAEQLKCEWEGDGNLDLIRVAPLESAAAGELTFAEGPKAFAAAAATQACVIAAPAYRRPEHQSVLRAAEPRLAAARAIALLHPRERAAPGVHPTAILSPDSEIDPTAAIGPYCIVGAGSRIGARTEVRARSIIGDNVQLGQDCLLHAGVTIHDDVSIGDRAILHSGVVIGADGFGFVFHQGRFEKFPQIGRVDIGHDVEVGANATIDRAALGVTRIGDGVKLDNMVHVGHNVRIGNHVVVAAQTGISGGAVIEDYVIIGGQVGIADKVRIEKQAVIGAKSGIPSSKIIRAGTTVWGLPARPIKDYLEELATLGKLTARRKELDALLNASRRPTESPAPPDAA